MLVPFISWLFLNVKLGTLVIAPPGAHTVIPAPPSIVGPRDDHVYVIPGIIFLKEYSATIMSGETYAPTLITLLELMSGGVPVCSKKLIDNKRL